MDDPKSSSSVPADLPVHKLAEMSSVSSLGPLGYIFSAGGSKTGEEVRNALVNAVPTVLLHNTGKIAMQWSVVVNELKALHKSGCGSMTDAEIAARLWDSMNRFYPTRLQLDAGEQVTQADVWQAIDVFRARPEVFLDTMAVVNPLGDSPEKALNMLSRCFASQATGMAELG